MDVGAPVVGQQHRDLYSTTAASAHSIHSKLGKSEGGPQSRKPPSISIFVGQVWELRKKDQLYIWTLSMLHERPPG